jgi:hypothetical protein
VEEALSEARARKPSTSFSDIPSEEVVSLIESVAELYKVRANRDVSVKDFARNVTDAMGEIDEVSLRISESGREEFESKLALLLGAEELSVTSKAKSLAVEDERAFCHARIMTELRPVFTEDAEAGPKAMVMVHRLKVVYHSADSEHKEIYLVLDADDLKTIRKQIDRAEVEARSLESILPEFRLFGGGEPESR